MSAHTSIQDQFLKALAGLGVLPGTSRIAVAVSGGVDSISLVALALETVPKDIVAILHVDHGVRIEAEEAVDLDCVLTIAVPAGVPVYVATLPHGEIEEASRLGHSVEDLARETRYSWFAAWITKLGLDYVLLAHHRDDEVETLLMELFQGRVPRGMPPRRGKFLRPLLDVPKTSVLDFAANRGLRWHDDVSNASTAHLRNAVRHTIVPAIESVFGSADRGLAPLREYVREAEELIAEQTRRLPAWSPRPDGSISLPVEDFLRSPAAIRRRLLEMGESTVIAGSTAGRDRRFWDGVVGGKAIKAGATRKYTLVQGRGIRLGQDRESLVMRACLAGAGENGYLLIVKGEGLIDLLDLFRLRVIREAGPVRGSSIRLDFPFVLRSPRKGELARLIVDDKTKCAVSRRLEQVKFPREVIGMLPLVEFRGTVCMCLTEPWLGHNLVIANGTHESESPQGQNLRLEFVR